MSAGDHSAFKTFALLTALVLGCAHAPFQSAVAQAPGSGWEEYECTLRVDEYFDGDSFKGKAHTRYTYIWRLYGVDCPETNDRFEQRLEEQAEYFGLPVSAIIPWGEKAREFTRNFLAEGFTVHTRKHKTLSSSRKNRYYAVVLVDGQRLDEALVEAGLARAHGQGVAWERDTATEFMERLGRMEARARAAKRGMWSGLAPGQSRPATLRDSLFSSPPPP